VAPYQHEREGDVCPIGQQSGAQRREPIAVWAVDVTGVGESHQEPKEDDEAAHHGACHGQGVIAFEDLMCDGHEEHLLRQDLESHALWAPLLHLKTAKESHGA